LAVREAIGSTMLSVALFDAQDEIDRQREQLIAEIEGKLQQKVSCEELFTIHWHVQ
jgi:adenine-specific DNA-methyltransferase